MATRIALVGASGRMGRVIAGLIEDADDLELAASLNSSTGLAALDDVDAVVDVTRPEVSPGIVAAAVAAGKPVLVGTSGWSAERIAVMASRLPADAPGVLIVPNFSVGAALAQQFAAEAARWYESIEIIETHHASKSDSPSGTAVAAAERIASARAALGPVAAPHPDQRARGQQVGSIPVHSLRMAGVVARQDVLFGGPGEVLTIRHETLSSDAYTAGILLALRALPSISGVVVGLERLLFADDSDSDADVESRS